jgi:hypothetical protein
LVVEGYQAVRKNIALLPYELMYEMYRLYFDKHKKSYAAKTSKIKFSRHLKEYLRIPQPKQEMVEAENGNKHRIVSIRFPEYEKFKEKVDKIK